MENEKRQVEVFLTAANEILGSILTALNEEMKIRLAAMATAFFFPLLYNS